MSSGAAVDAGSEKLVESKLCIFREQFYIVESYP